MVVETATVNRTRTVIGMEIGTVIKTVIGTVIRTGTGTVWERERHGNERITVFAT